MRIEDVIVKLREDVKKQFVILNYHELKEDYGNQVHYNIVGKWGGKICYVNDKQTLQLSYSILELCEFAEILQ